jgi:hypothetical protein
MVNKKRLIDANKYPCQTCDVSYCYQNCSKFIAWFEKTVDAVEVVHGEWRCVSLDPQDPYFICSNCRIGYSTIYHECEEMKYCPNCGARMDGE